MCVSYFDMGYHNVLPLRIAHSEFVIFYTTAGPYNIGGIQFQQLTAPVVDPAVFQLSRTYNGSPANGSSFSSYQNVTDLAWSTYNNILVVRGNMAGVYNCTVTTLCAPVCGSFMEQRSFTSSRTLQGTCGMLGVNPPQLA